LNIDSIFYIVTKDQKRIISGGSDSLLIIWKDVTEEMKARIASEKEQLVLEEQKLANLLQAEELQIALQLALKLERPLQVFKIIEGTVMCWCFIFFVTAILKKGNSEFAEIMKALNPTYKKTLLKCAVTWNMNSRNSHAAQVLFKI